MVLMLCPIVPEGANAATGESEIGGGGQNTSSTTVPSISMALSSRTELDVTPTASGVFQTGTANLKVAVNLPESYYIDGFVVSMKAIGNDNSLKGGNSSSTSISSLTTNTTVANFPNNTWGYNLLPSGTTISDSTQFMPIPTTSTVIQNSSTTEGVYDLNFATKIDTTVPADQYSNSVLVSVVAEPELAIRLTELTYMQEMTTGNCWISQEGDTKQLVDTRDGQKYWVAKMKDGNCWMTQNLALDITTEGLKAADTDITRDWTAAQSADPSVETVDAPRNTYTSVYSGNNDNNATYSWNLNGIGKNQWVLGTPLKTTSCGDSSSGIRNLGNCVNIGFVKIDDSWSPTFEAKEGVFNAPDTDYTGETTYITLDYNKKEYDAHYLIGNYYSWNAVTAGTGQTIINAQPNTDAAGSICPKGWQLPSSGDSAASPSTTKKTFARLLKEYGVASTLSTTGTNTLPEIVDGEENYNIAAAPLYFARGGVVLPQSGYRVLSNAGLEGDYNTGYGGYYNSRSFFRLNQSNTGHFSSQQTFVGYSIRCVAR